MRAWRIVLVFTVLLTIILLTFSRFSMWFSEQIVSLIITTPEITTMELETRVAMADSNLILFDVRSSEEFGISHIPDATHLDPNTTSAEFIRKFGSKIRGKNLVFYCSVGYRSSKTLQKVDLAAIANGAESLRNLRGGIFRWYNEGLTVVNGEGPTDDVHPYGSFWRFLVRQRP